MAEEPVNPMSPESKPQPTSLSMFEGAMMLEQEREAAPVGVRR